MSTNEEYIAGIDIGTTKITTLIGKVEKNNILQIKGYGISGSNGIKKGLIVDINEATKSILHSIEMAERTTKVFVDSAYIGVTGKHISFISNWSDININSPNSIIRKVDVDRLISTANKVNLSTQYEVIHTLIKQFVIDEEKGIVDPIGLSAKKLSVELLAIYGTTSLINNVVNSVRAAKVEVEDIIIEALASSEAVLTPEEKESGVILLDIGGGTTDVAIYKDKKMLFTYCLPVGGDLITNDISIGLNITLPKAEEIKKKFANVDYNFYDTLNKVNIGDIKIDSNKTTLNIRLYNIVNCRVKELLNLVKEKVEGYSFMHEVPCGLVITGGTSMLKGIAPLANAVFNLPVRLGIPSDTEGPAEVISDPIYSTGVGLLKYAYQMKNYRSLDQIGEKKEQYTFLNRFRDFILKILKNESR
ncbi:MAG TPA: cell division protein FtsA [Candidatus Humimicrobiaceae bacterium]|nr:cell division protein FtsA [Candidatus Humimicrobiaceae bacterium]